MRVVPIARRRWVSSSDMNSCASSQCRISGAPRWKKISSSKRGCGPVWGSDGRDSFVKLSMMARASVSSVRA